MITFKKWLEHRDPNLFINRFISAMNDEYATPNEFTDEFITEQQRRQESEKDQGEI